MSCNIRARTSEPIAPCFGYGLARCHGRAGDSLGEGDQSLSSLDRFSGAKIELALGHDNTFYLGQDAEAANATFNVVEREDLDGTQHGEPITASVIIGLTAAGLKALAAFWGRNRRQGRVTYTTTVTEVDGTVRKKELTVDFVDDPASAIAQIGSALGLADHVVKAAEALG